MSQTTRAEFETIVDSHIRLVYRIAYRLLGSNSDAEDIAQIVFAEAYRLHRNKNIGNWTGFLTRLATHRSLDLLRSKHRKTVAISETVPSAVCDPHDELVGKEIADWLRTEVARLPGQQATVFALICFEDMDRNQVAKLLGISVASVSTALHKARQKLQQRITIWQ